MLSTNAKSEAIERWSLNPNQRLVRTWLLWTDCSAKLGVVWDMDRRMNWVTRKISKGFWIPWGLFQCTWASFYALVHGQFQHEPFLLGVNQKNHLNLPIKRCHLQGRSQKKFRRESWNLGPVTLNFHLCFMRFILLWQELINLEDFNLQSFKYSHGKMPFVILNVRSSQGDDNIPRRWIS